MNRRMDQDYLTYQDEGFASKAQQEFWNKSIPVLIIGFAIWGVTSFIFSEYGLTMDIGVSILLMIIYIPVWIATILLAHYRKNAYSMISFFIATFITGLVTAPLFGYLIYFVGVTETAKLFLISTTISASSLTGCYVIGWIARKKNYGTKPWGLFLFGALILFLILEPIVFIVVGSFNLFYFIFSLLMIGWMYACGIWYGLLLEDEMKADAWMYFVLGYFLTLINIIVRLMRIFAISNR
ncbi:MAG: hypothetical protein EAX96_08270 [Candidatus Lokiarchaeota archaeon]|nr:hypothetical protein [Candidatus Lokiarchaeota archaeon]